MVLGYFFFLLFVFCPLITYKTAIVTGILLETTIITPQSVLVVGGTQTCIKVVFFNISIEKKLTRCLKDGISVCSVQLANSSLSFMHPLFVVVRQLCTPINKGTSYCCNCFILSSQWLIIVARQSHTVALAHIPSAFPVFVDQYRFPITSICVLVQ